MRKSDQFQAFDIELFRLNGQIALVTGAVGGLGFEIARALAEMGATVGIHGRDRTRTEAACAQIANAEPVVFDLMDQGAVIRETTAFCERHGRLDVLVGNAGIRDRRSLAETSVEKLQEMLMVNLVANFSLARCVAPFMTQGGSMIFVTTNAAMRGAKRGSTYTASKGGLDALTRALAVELGPRNIRVNALSPGHFATDFNRELVADPQTAAMIEHRVPLKRWADPAELIGPALFLASRASSYVTGHRLVVDGGASIAV